MIYVNGDSHSAGAEIIKDYCFAEDDPKYTIYGRRPHPEAVQFTFGYRIATALNQPFHLDAESASSNDRILRTTRKFISETKDRDKLFVIIGWTTWEREEWLHNDSYYQITASGTDILPQELKDTYKHWVTEQTPKTKKQKQDRWLEIISNFSNELDEQGIKHFFFHTDEYIAYCNNQGFQTVNNGYHYGVDAHIAWSKVLLNEIRSIFSTKTLTNNKTPVIVKKAKFRDFSGFNR